MIPVSNRPQIVLAEQYDGATSLINCGAHTEQTPFAQTCVAVVFPTGSGELSTGTVFSVTPASANTGVRMYVGDNTGAPNVVFNAHSTGSSGNPSRSSAANTAVYNAWNFIAATWDGGLTAATSIKIYAAQGGKDVAETAYLSSVDGVTAAQSGAGNNLVFGNRGNADRTFAGSIAYVARWERVLTGPEISQVQRSGPLSVPSGLILCWANGRDYGPYGVAAMQKVAVTFRAPPTTYTPLGTLRRRLPLNSVAAGGFFSRYYYDMLAA